MADGFDIYGNYILPAVTGVKNAAVSLFAPSDTAPGDYTSRLADIARQQKLAEALSQMGQQEQAVSTAGGITAPMSPMGALARGLTSFGGSYLAGKAAADEAAAKKAGTEQLANAVSQFGMPYKTTDQTAAPVDIGGEPVQQYVMKPPTAQEQMGEAARIMTMGVPGAETIGSSLFSNVAKQQSADLELKKQLSRLQPLIAGLPPDQQTRISTLAAADPETALKTIQSITESQFKTPTPSEVSKLIRERDALPPNDPRRLVYDQKLAGIKSPEAIAQELNIHATENAGDLTRKAASVMPDDATLDRIASSVLSGDKSEATGYGRNPLVQKAINERITSVGAARGMSGPDISRAKQDYNAGTAAIKAFDTGKQGDSVRSLNVVTQHLALGRELVNALQNNDINAINYVKNKWKEQTGQEAPTNLQGAAEFLGNEMQKATLGQAGAAGERTAIARGFSTSRSPAQLLGNINTAEGFIAGQAQGLQKQYETSTGRKDFEIKLLPETIAAIQKHSNAPIPANGKTKTGVGFKILGQ
jgi:hypothetical protein